MKITTDSNKELLYAMEYVRNVKVLDINNFKYPVKRTIHVISSQGHSNENKNLRLLEKKFKEAGYNLSLSYLWKLGTERYLRTLKTVLGAVKKLQNKTFDFQLHVILIQFSSFHDRFKLYLACRHIFEKCLMFILVKIQYCFKGESSFNLRTVWKPVSDGFC